VKRVCLELLRLVSILEVSGYIVSQLLNGTITDSPISRLQWVFCSPRQERWFRQEICGGKGIARGIHQTVPSHWRLDNWERDYWGEGRDEWTLISGFENVDHHMWFAKMEEFAKYREIVWFLEGLEVKHLKAIEGL
jgi:hypothetical protein